MASGLLQWHDGFHASFQIELQEESAHLEFYSEHELYKKALRVDTLVIKNSDTPVQKKIGKIFRKFNLIEYKSPGDSLNINDFYKVYGYACLYQSKTKKVHEISMKDISISFVCSHYPRKMLKILKNERGIEAQKVEEGIYRLKNDSVSIQILVVNQLPPEENRWLSSLRRNLPMDRNTEHLLREYQRHMDSVLYQSAMDLIIQANKNLMKGEGNMVCDALKEIFAEEWKEKELQMQKKESQIQKKESQMQQKESQIQEKESQIQEREFQMQERELLLLEREKKAQRDEQRLSSLIQFLQDNLTDDLKKILADRADFEDLSII